MISSKQIHFAREEDTELDGIMSGMWINFMEYIDEQSPLLVEILEKHSGGKSEDADKYIDNMLKTTTLNDIEKFHQQDEVLIYLLIDFLEKTVGFKSSPFPYTCSEYLEISEDEKFNKYIRKFDEKSWEEFKAIMAKTYAANIKGNRQILYEAFKIINPSITDGAVDFEINSSKTVDVFIAQYSEFLKVLLSSSVNSFEMLMDKVIESDTEKIKKIYRHVIDCKFDSSDQEYALKITNAINSYCINNHMHDIAGKYSLIILYTVADKNFSEKKFRKVMKDRFFNMRWNKFDFAKHFLVSLLKLDSTYQQKKNKCINFVNTIEKLETDNSKDSEKNREHIMNTYKERMESRTSM